MAGRALALALVLASLAAGCDWRDFDQLKERTPVVSMGPPGEFPKGDFGRHLLPLSGPPAGAKGASFLVSAASTGCVAPVDVDAKGHASGRSVCSSVFGTADPVFPNTALAQVPGTRKVLLGAPQAEMGTGAVYVIDLAKDNQVTRFDSPPDGERFGLGVAAGALAGGDAPDFVVASELQLTVYVDGDATKGVVAPDAAATCPLEIPTTLSATKRLNRAVLVAPLMDGPASQIVVGTPAASPGMGAVSVFNVDPTTGQATCAFALRGAEERFGHALATGDFDGDRTKDLLIGAPPGKVYWVRGPLAMGAPLLPVAVGTPAAGSDLGSSVAAANLDGQPGDEALVGDPGATVGGQTGAGEVRIVTGTMPAAGLALDKLLTVVRRHDPSANDAYGAQVGVLPFTGARPLLLVGAQTRSYLYFLLLSGDQDPREP